LDPNKINVKAYHRFYTPVKTKDGTYIIRIVAKEDINSDTLIPVEATLYDVVIKKKIPPLPQQRPQAAESC